MEGCNSTYYPWLVVACKPVPREKDPWLRYGQQDANGTAAFLLTLKKLGALNRASS